MFLGLNRFYLFRSTTITNLFVEAIFFYVDWRKSVTSGNLTLHLFNDSNTYNFRKFRKNNQIGNGRYKYTPM